MLVHHQLLVMVLVLDAQLAMLSQADFATNVKSLTVECVIQRMSPNAIVALIVTMSPIMYVHPAQQVVQLVFHNPHALLVVVDIP
jgi:hypothetical protein